MTSVKPGASFFILFCFVEARSVYGALTGPELTWQTRLVSDLYNTLPVFASKVLGF